MTRKKQVFFKMKTVLDNLIITIETYKRIIETMMQRFSQANAARNITYVVESLNSLEVNARETIKYPVSNWVNQDLFFVERERQEMLSMVNAILHGKADAGWTGIARLKQSLKEVESMMARL